MKRYLVAYIWHEDSTHKVIVYTVKEEAVLAKNRLDSLPDLFRDVFVSEEIKD